MKNNNLWRDTPMKQEKGQDFPYQDNLLGRKIVWRQKLHEVLGKIKPLQYRDRR